MKSHKANFNQSSEIDLLTFIKDCFFLKKYIFLQTGKVNNTKKEPIYKCAQQQIYHVKIYFSRLNSLNKLYQSTDKFTFSLFTHPIQTFFGQPMNII